MDDKVISLCDLTIDNYRKVKEELRYDGEYINHFASLIYSNFGIDIPVKKIKEVRKYIKDKTSRMSCFRGDILYMLSLLVVKEENIKIFIEDILNAYDELLESGLKESQYLVLTAYTIVKHSEKNKVFENIYKIKEVYETIKAKYGNVTNEEDYLECALLVLSGINKDEITNSIDDIFENISDLDMFSRNSVQGLAMSILLNKDKVDLYAINEILIEFEKRDMKISHQFLPFMGVVLQYDNPKKYVSEVSKVIDYLCKEESLYEFYMDKSFRIFIAIVIIEFENSINEERYLNELLSMCVYSFLMSKNQGLFAEILA